jgi:catechol 2,3-dioxygenase-like lactoylglutathione lyase family enzyme
MFGSFNIVPCIATRDLKSAKKFYRDILGLRLLKEDDGTLEFNANGTILRLLSVPDLAPAKHLVLVWDVPDIVDAANYLRKAGVEAVRFPHLREQDELGIITTREGTRVVEFADPDGNMLSIAQRA